MGKEEKIGSEGKAQEVTAEKQRKKKVSIHERAVSLKQIFKYYFCLPVCLLVLHYNGILKAHFSGPSTNACQILYMEFVSKMTEMDLQNFADIDEYMNVFKSSTLIDKSRQDISKEIKEIWTKMEETTSS